MNHKLFFHKGKAIPKLGFGCMRLPVHSDGKINMEDLKEMVDYYIENDGCYFDTAYGYHKQQSELALREALVHRYPRDSYVIATKLPAWKFHIHSSEEAQGIFYTQLERLDCGYIDYYLFQNMGEERTAAFERYDLWNFVKERKAEGLIRHFGISFHDKAEHLRVLFEKHPEIEFVQLQINYADWENPVVEARKCWETAREFGKPIVVMEPVKGGVLTTLPAKVQEVLCQSEIKQSNPEWALRFAASRENVVLVLSGMSNMEQLKENLTLFKNEKPFLKEEEETLARARKELEKLDQIPCTDCKYCYEECPGKVKISKIMTALNFHKIFDNKKMATHYYFSNVFLSGKASDCLSCGKCEVICPQRIPVRRMLKEAVQIFGE